MIEDFCNLYSPYSPEHPTEHKEYQSMIKDFYRRYGFEKYTPCKELEGMILEECQECIERERRTAINNTEKGESNTMIDKEALKQRYGCNYQEQYIDIHLALEAQECVKRERERSIRVAKVAKAHKLKNLEKAIVKQMAERDRLNNLLKGNAAEYKALKGEL